MPVQKIGDVITTSGGLRALDRQARRLRDLQQVLYDATPAPLAAASRVTDLSTGILVVSADNAAIAAKLRQLTPRLLSHFRKLGAEVTGIRVVVQVKTPADKVAGDLKKHPLAPDVIKKFSELTEKLSPSPLKSALARLVARHAPRKPK